MSQGANHQPPPDPLLYPDPRNPRPNPTAAPVNPQPVTQDQGPFITPPGPNHTISQAMQAATDVPTWQAPTTQARTAQQALERSGAEPFTLFEQLQRMREHYRYIEQADVSKLAAAKDCLVPIAGEDRETRNANWPATLGLTRLVVESLFSFVSNANNVTALGLNDSDLRMLIRGIVERIALCSREEMERAERGYQVLCQRNPQ